MTLAISPLDLGLDIAGGVFVVGVTTAVAVTVHRVRRRLRALRHSPATRGALAIYDAVRSPGGLRRGGSPARMRLDLWQAVSAATRAVRRAQEAGGGVGELPSLCRRLRHVAEELDRLLSMTSGLHPGAAPVADLRRQLGDALRASESIRLAALAYTGGTAALGVDQLAADADLELRSVNAGVTQTRAELSPP